MPTSWIIQRPNLNSSSPVRPTAKETRSVRLAARTRQGLRRSPSPAFMRPSLSLLRRHATNNTIHRRLPPTRTGIHPKAAASRRTVENGPSRITLHRPNRVTIRNDRTRTPRSRLGHEEMQSLPRGTPSLRSSAGPPPSDSHSQRLQPGSTGQPTHHSTETQNDALLFPRPLGARQRKHRGRCPVSLSSGPTDSRRPTGRRTVIIHSSHRGRRNDC